MKINLSVRNIAIGSVITLLFVLLLSTRCSHRREVDRLNTGLYASKKEVNTQLITINKLQQRVFYSEFAVTSSQEAIKRLEGEKEYFEKLHINNLKSISKLELEVSVLKKQGAYMDTVIVLPDTFNTDDSGFMPLSSQGNDTLRYVDWKDKWAWANVLLYPDKPVVSLGLYESPMRIQIYYKGIIKPKPTVAITSENPYLKINSASTIVVEDKKKLYQKKYPYFIAGILGGWLIFK